jgi:hypothetical protein
MPGGFENGASELSHHPNFYIPLLKMFLALMDLSWMQRNKCHYSIPRLGRMQEMS